MKKRIIYPALIYCMLVFFQTNAQLYLAPVYTVQSSQTPQNGEEAYFAIDGDNNTIYHSQWGYNGIPDTLDFYFTSRVHSISRIVYTPRQSGYNGIWTNVNIFYSTQNDPDHFFEVQEGTISWEPDDQDKTIDLLDIINTPAIVRFVVNMGYNNYSSCAEMRFYSQDEISNYDEECFIASDELVPNEAIDRKVAIIAEGTTASSFQPSENIDRSFDNDLTTLYHSSYNSTTFPVILNYRFDGETIIDYLKYIPRSDGGSNGDFGNVVISYNTNDTGQGSDFIPILSYDFGELGKPTIVEFPISITPRNIKISVENGVGDFASCAEMEFYTKTSTDSSSPYTTIFADDIYSELHSYVDQSDIDTINSVFFRNLAQCLFDSTYNRQYRIQSYQIYPSLSTVRNTLKLSSYNAFENPTGIVFKENEKAVIFAKDIEDIPVYLRIRDFADEENPQDQYYQIRNGMNVIPVSNNGLGYISYYGDTPSPDITLHITTGKVNGYFNYETSTNQDWIDLLSGPHYPKVDVIGKFTHLVYDKSGLVFGSPFDGHALVSKYDTIVNLQRLQMGLYKFNKSPKNRQLAYSGYGGGWYAGGLGVHLDLDWGIESVTSPTKLGLWGIAHEFGHVNQIRPDIRWHGLIEVTTNIYSTWATYHLNEDKNKFTRLESDVVRPSQDLPAIAGGRINGFITNTSINNEALQGSEDYDVFKILVPFWQLQLYYSLAGASRGAPALTFEAPPEDYTGIDYANWFGIVAETSRNTDSGEMTTGQLLLNFVKNTCDAVQEDLTDFFIKTGFLRPIDKSINDYGVQQVVVTQNEIDETIAYIRAKEYDEPISPVINYISAHSVEIFKDKRPLIGQNGEGLTLHENTITIQHDVWQNAIAYEVYDEEEELILVAISGTGDITNQTTTIHYPIENHTVYAVGFDGSKILVYPRLTSVENNKFNSYKAISPNPVGSNDKLRIGIDNKNESYSVMIFTMDGKVIFRQKDLLQNIENSINDMLPNIMPGAYILNLYNNSEDRFYGKFIKK